MPTLADVKLPQSERDAAIDTQVHRLHILADKFSASESKSLNSLGELLQDIADELEKTTSPEDGDASVSDEIQQAVTSAKVS